MSRRRLARVLFVLFRPLCLCAFVLLWRVVKTESEGVDG